MELENVESIINVQSKYNTACDCPAPDCPGCYLPCNKCQSTKCGMVCRKDSPSKIFKKECYDETRKTTTELSTRKFDIRQPLSTMKNLDKCDTVSQENRIYEVRNYLAKQVKTEQIDTSDDSSNRHEIQDDYNDERVDVQSQEYIEIKNEYPFDQDKYNDLSVLGTSEDEYVQVNPDSIANSGRENYENENLIPENLNIVPSETADGEKYPMTTEASSLANIETEEIEVVELSKIDYIVDSESEDDETIPMQIEICSREDIVTVDTETEEREVVKLSKILYFEDSESEDEPITMYIEIYLREEREE